MRRILTAVIFLINFNCNLDHNAHRVFQTPECLQNPEKVTIKMLKNSPVRYHSHFVEISGFYEWGTEQSSVSEKFNEKPMIWINFSFDLVDSLEKDDLPNESIFLKMIGKKLKIRGVVDTNDHGHLGGYFATIRNICFVEF